MSPDVHLAQTWGPSYGEHDATGGEKKRAVYFKNLGYLIWHSLKRDVLEGVPSSILDRKP